MQIMRMSRLGFTLYSPARWSMVIAATRAPMPLLLLTSLTFGGAFGLQDIIRSNEAGL